MDKLVSLIVPFFNTGRHIIDCLQSIKNQTYTCYEVLLIDDGSTDDTKDYCREYLRDSRFKYFYKDNSGVSSSRNFGIELAKGDYISFVDSDDILNENFLATLINISIQNNNSVVACKHVEFVTTPIWVNYGQSLEKVVLDYSFSHENHWEAGVIWGKLYPRNCLNEIRFSTKYHVSEDTLFFTQVLVGTKEYNLVKKALYGYRIQEDSAIHGEYNLKKHTQIQALLDASDAIRPFSEKDYIFLRGEIAARCKQAAKSYTLNDSIWNEIIENYKKNYKFMRKKGLKSKITSFLFYKFPNIYRTIAMVCKYD